MGPLTTNRATLPDLPFPAAPDVYPGKDEVANYLLTYQRRFGIPVRLDTPVRRLVTYPDGYAAETPSGTLLARQVVLATGPFQRPRVPPAAHDLRSQVGEEVSQLHSSQYRRPEALPEGPVLVVGGGNSGIQIAAELSRTRPTTLAVGSRLPWLPTRLAGCTIFWWLNHLGVLTVPIPPPAGRWWRRRDFLIGDNPRRLGRRGVTLAGRVVAADRGRLRCADGSLHQPHTVIWATGYTPDFSWVDLPVVTPDGWIDQWAGRTRLPGLWVLGLPWQRSAGSALLGWVGRDALRLVGDIIRHHQTFRRT